VDDDRAVAKEGRSAWLSRRIEVVILGRERVRGDPAILAAQVTHLAGLGLGGIASRSLATTVWVQVRPGQRAVAVGGRPLMNVVHEGTTLLGEVLKPDGELDALPIGGCYSGDIALDIPLQRSICEEGFFGQKGPIDNARRVAGNDGRIASYNTAEESRRGQGQNPRVPHFEGDSATQEDVKYRKPGSLAI